MNEWNDASSVYPKHGDKVIIRVYDRKTDRMHELKATFIDTEIYRSWEFIMPEGADIVHLPKEWKYDGMCC
jgi:hypothetical protein